MDVIHGYETVFPIPLALSCSWDMEAIERSARVAAVEASAAGVNWTFSPMVDISRDPRWGRMSEGSGEDPYLGSEIARAMVRGYQGDLKNNDEILACVKHFALYGASEAGRDYNTVDMSRSRMYNEYFAPYKAAVDEGAATVMTSFNLVDGVPATENKWLLDDVLRGQWGFDGMVVTDYGSIGEVSVHGLENSRSFGTRPRCRHRHGYVLLRLHRHAQAERGKRHRTYGEHRQGRAPYPRGKISSWPFRQSLQVCRPQA